MPDPSITVSEPSPPDTPGAATPPTGSAPSETPGSGSTSPEPPSRAGTYSLRMVGLIFVVGIILIALFFGAVRHWVALHTGVIHGGPDQYYNFWSGFGSDLGEATLITAVALGVYTGVRRVNCHVKGCWRIGRHALDGTPYVLCRHHHPAVPTAGASHEHILDQHRKAMTARKAEHG
jgi:hypothetical protein